MKYLVGGLEHGSYEFPYIGNNPSQLTFILFRGVETTNQVLFSEIASQTAQVIVLFSCFSVGNNITNSTSHCVAFLFFSGK